MRSDVLNELEMGEIRGGKGDDDVTSADKTVENWLPITSNRNAKWYFSAFHNVTAMVGAGVLGLPYAMAHLGWYWGVTVMLLSYCITLYTLWQMVEMHEMDGRRYDRYQELAQRAFGDKLGLYILVPQQLIVEVGTDIVYMVTGGRSLMRFWLIVSCSGPQCETLYHLAMFIAIFAAIQFGLSMLPNFHSISGVSFVAAVMSLSYSMIAAVSCLMRGQVDGVSYGSPLATASGFAKCMGVFDALGTVAFAYAGHNVVLEIQATIPSTPEKPSKRPMWWGVVVAYIVVAICYFPVAFLGYWSFGNAVKDNILESLEHPPWLIATANFMVFLHVVGSYQIYAMPVFDNLESLLVKVLKFKPRTTLRVVARTTYNICTMFIAMLIPFFGALLGFLGGLALAPTTYYIPCIIWLLVMKPKRFSVSWWFNVAFIAAGLGLTAVAPIGGMYNIIKSWGSYKLFS